MSIAVRFRTTVGILGEVASPARKKSDLRCKDIVGFAGVLISVNLVLLLVGGCVDSVVEPRSEILNRSFTDYRNQATLLNIVRASHNEPMNFVAVTGATGHGTLSATEGLQNYIFGPHTTPTLTAPVPARNYVFGPNSLMESAANDFNITELDDPQSYAALMTPLDPGMIGVFFNRNWPVSLLLPLIISEIRVIPIPTSKDKEESISYAFYTNQRADARKFYFCKSPPGVSFEETYDTYCDYKVWSLPPKAEDADYVAWMLGECSARRAFCVPPAYILITYLNESGLVFQIPTGAVPGQAQSARICFDSPRSQFSPQESLTTALQDLFHFRTEDNRRIIHPFTDKDLSDSWGETDITMESKAKVYRCDDTNLQWVKLTIPSQANVGMSTSASLTNLPATGLSVCVKPGACASARNASQGPKAMAMYEFFDPRINAIIQLFTRSTWGIYSFLGDVVRNEEQTHIPLVVLVKGFQKDHELFRVVENTLENCFASVLESGVSYCVPKTAFNAKMILSLLHELANLYTRPNPTQQPNTGTVRVTPG